MKELILILLLGLFLVKGTSALVSYSPQEVIQWEVTNISNIEKALFEDNIKFRGNYVCLRLNEDYVKRLSDEKIDTRDINIRNYELEVKHLR